MKKEKILFIENNKKDKKNRGNMEINLGYKDEIDMVICDINERSMKTHAWTHLCLVNFVVSVCNCCRLNLCSFLFEFFLGNTQEDKEIQMERGERLLTYGEICNNCGSKQRKFFFDPPVPVFLPLHACSLCWCCCW